MILENYAIAEQKKKKIAPTILWRDQVLSTSKYISISALILTRKERFVNGKRKNT